MWTKRMRNPEDAFPATTPNPRRTAGLRDLERIVDALVESGLFRAVAPLESSCCGGTACGLRRGTARGAAV